MQTTTTTTTTKIKATAKIKDKLIISDEDYETLNTYVRGMMLINASDKNNAVMLNEELKKAKLVKKNKLPPDVVRLNSRVKIKEGNKDKVIELTLVMPEKADIKERRVSVFAPIGTALIGFRQGQKVEWQVPAGNKTFTIVEVDNHEE